MDSHTTESLISITGDFSSDTDNKQWTILCVDDESSVLSSLKRLLRKASYHVLTADSGATALELMKTENVDLIISDMRMPGMSGAELFSQVALDYPEVTRLLLTGYSDMESTIAAVNMGKIHKYLQKPWNNDEILLIIEQELEYKQLAAENKILSQQIKIQNDELINLNIELESRIQKRTLQIQQALQKLEQKNNINKENNRSILKVFYNLLSMNEHLDGHKAMLISQLCILIGRRLNYSTYQLKQLKLAAILHELGLLCVDSSLIKPAFADLSKEQKRLYRSHPEQAYTAMAPVAHLSSTASIILHQYECVNGGGVPEKLPCDLIPEESRILAIARDFINATQGKLFSTRLSEQGALEYLNQRAGSIYDANILELLPELLCHLDCDTLERDEKIVATSQLKSGMTLSRDVMNSKAILLLAEGNTLTEESIERLASFEKTEKQLLKIYILQHDA